jgi:hypothetical protein
MDPSSDLSFLKNSSRNSLPCDYYKKNPAQSKSPFPNRAPQTGKEIPAERRRVIINPSPQRLPYADDIIGQGGIMTKKISTEEFVRLAIVKLRNEPYKGIHSVYSGFNEAFKDYYGGQDPVQATTRLAEDGKIVIRPMKGGVVLYLPEEAPLVKSRSEEALKKMGLL